jgi:ABC-type sugar transport system ATPase subunit
MGNEQLLHVVVDGHAMVGRMSATQSASVSEEVLLEVNPERVHFFDAQTEQALA